MRPSTWFFVPQNAFSLLFFWKFTHLNSLEVAIIHLCHHSFWLASSVHCIAVSYSTVVCNVTVQYCLCYMFKANWAVLTEVCALLFCNHRPCYEKLLQFQLFINLDYLATNLIDFSSDKLQKYDVTRKKLCIPYIDIPMKQRVKFRVLIHWC